MNQLAVEMNSILEPTVAGRLLSRFGKEIFFPKGIVAQSAEAAGKAKRFNATIGMAVDHGKPLVLPSVRSQIPGLTEDQMASYAPTGGIPALRNSWLKQLKTKNPDLDIQSCTLPMVVPGLTNGIVQCADLFVNENDTVIIPDLHWDNYDLVFGVRKGADVQTFPLFSDAGQFNVKGLSELLDRLGQKGIRKLAIVLNFPNNPSGYTPSDSETANIVEALKASAEKGTDILVICDDAYYGLFYEPETARQSIFVPFSRAHRNILAVKVDGSTKEDFSWGFRLGFVTFAGAGLNQDHRDQLVKKLMGSIRSSISNSSMLAQNVLMKAYESPGYAREKSEAFSKLEARYRKAKAIIQAKPWPAATRTLQALPFNSGYFMTFRCHGISSESLRLALLEKGIGTINFNDTHLRVAYAATDLEDLEALYEEIFSTAETLVRD